MTGVLAMGLHSVGMVGKLYAEAIEQIDEGPRARSAPPAPPGGRMIAGVLPQVLPSFVATALHRLDINLRVSVVLGFVGVNGIGYAIANAFRRWTTSGGWRWRSGSAAVRRRRDGLGRHPPRAAARRGRADRRGRTDEPRRPDQPAVDGRRVRGLAYAVVTLLIVLLVGGG